LDVKPIVSKIAELITSQQDDEWLSWITHDKVKLQIGKIIPDYGANKTLRSRRKRLRDELEGYMLVMGWQVYTHGPSTFIERVATSK